MKEMEKVRGCNLFSSGYHKCHIRQSFSYTMNRVSAYIKLLRLPGLGGLAIPPVFGAISVGVSDPSSLAILFAI